jgi:uncharacterized protein (DUF488 family)
MSVLYTIGFAGWTAEAFFGSLAENRVLRVLDVRLRNNSQLAGFAKRDDLRYFLAELSDAEYQHLPALAPTPELLRGYRDKSVTWAQYEEIYTAILLQSAALADLLSRGVDRACFLCSEHEPEHCHRRLLAEHIATLQPGTRIVHLT